MIRAEVKPEMMDKDREYIREVLVRMGLTDEFWLSQEVPAIWEKIWESLGNLKFMLETPDELNP